MNLTEARNVVIGRNTAALSAASITIPEDMYLVDDALVRSLLLSGFAGTLTDEAWATLNLSDQYQVLDFAEYYLLQTALTNVSAVDEKLGPMAISNSQYAARLRQQLERMNERLSRLYPSVEADGVGFIAWKDYADE